MPSHEDPADQVAIATEKARHPLNAAFQAKVYPHWQEPLAALAERPGVDRAGLHLVNGFPEAVNREAVIASLGRSDFLVSEVITVETDGLVAGVAYAIAGLPKRALMVRFPVFRAGGQPEIVVDHLEKWGGTLDELCAAAVADIPAAAELLGVMTDVAGD